LFIGMLFEGLDEKMTQIVYIRPLMNIGNIQDEAIVLLNQKLKKYPNVY